MHNESSVVKALALWYLPCGNFINISLICMWSFFQKRKLHWSVLYFISMKKAISINSWLWLQYHLCSLRIAAKTYFNHVWNPMKVLKYTSLRTLTRKLTNKCGMVWVIKGTAQHKQYLCQSTWKWTSFLKTLFLLKTGNWTKS